MAQGGKFEHRFISGGVYAEHVKNSYGKFISWLQLRLLMESFIRMNFGHLMLELICLLTYLEQWRAWNGFLFW